MHKDFLYPERERGRLADKRKCEDDNKINVIFRVFTAFLVQEMVL
jgi:hypothetical protein